MLEVRGLTKQFNKQEVLTKIHLSAQPGTLTVIQGCNGSGKTTLLKCLAGLLNFEQGQITFGKNTLCYNNPSCREVIGFSPNTDNSFFPQLTLVQNINFFSGLFKQRSDADELFRLFELSPWKHKSYQTCSSGIKKRISILRALSHRPKILLLDEPFSHIDSQFTKKLEFILEDITYKQRLVTILTTNQETSIDGHRVKLKGKQHG